MPMNEGGKEAAILVFAMPKKPGRGVTPPTMAQSKKSEKAVLPGMDYEEDDTCEECGGEGCPECETESEDNGQYGMGAENSHKKHMKIISKLVEMLDKE